MCTTREDHLIVIQYSAIYKIQWVGDANTGTKREETQKERKSGAI